MRTKIPTYAAVMATAAVMLALSGTAVAAAKIDGHDLMDRSVPGDKLVKNGVTGTEVKESSLAKVPDAGHLDGLGPNAFVQGTSSTLATGSSKYVPVVSVPGVARVTTKCSADGQDETFHFVNTSLDVEYFTVQKMRENETVSGPIGSFMNPGIGYDVFVGSDATTNAGYSVSFDVLSDGGKGAHFELHGITKLDGVETCLVRGTATHG